MPTDHKKISAQQIFVTARSLGVEISLVDDRGDGEPGISLRGDPEARRAIKKLILRGDRDLLVRGLQSVRDRAADSEDERVAEKLTRLPWSPGGGVKMLPPLCSRRSCGKFATGRTADGSPICTDCQRKMG